ncbi:hypothetical protein DFH06DRAFT_1220049, partial [Mycena polygramma]
MSYDTMTIIDLLDELDLDIQGFADAPYDSEPTLLFAPFLYPEASTSTLDVASTMELPRKWVAAGPPIWDCLPEPSAAHHSEDRATRRALQPLSIDVPPRSPSRATSPRLPKENLISPTARSFAKGSPTDSKFSRLRVRGSNLALKAMNSALSSPEMSHRVL